MVNHRVGIAKRPLGIPLRLSRENPEHRQQPVKTASAQFSSNSLVSVNPSLRPTSVTHSSNQQERTWAVFLALGATIFSYPLTFAVHAP